MKHTNMLTEHGGPESARHWRMLTLALDRPWIWLRVAARGSRREKSSEAHWIGRITCIRGNTIPTSTSSCFSQRSNPTERWLLSPALRELLCLSSSPSAFLQLLCISFLVLLHKSLLLYGHAETFSPPLHPPASKARKMA